MSPGGPPVRSRKEQSDMQGDGTEREARIFTLVVGCLMAGLILFGVLELLDVFRV
jgi:hypothetical protein